MNFIAKLLKERTITETRYHEGLGRIPYRVGILKQNAKSRYSGIPGFEVRRNSPLFFA
jgi:hypothetical protein